MYESVAIGDTAGRNLIPWPKFEFGSNGDWETGAAERAGAALDDSSKAYRVIVGAEQSPFYAIMHPLATNLTPGDEMHIYAHVANSSTYNDGTIRLVPYAGEFAVTDKQASLKVPKQPGDTSYTHLDADVTLPAWDTPLEIYDDYGALIGTYEAGDVTSWNVELWHKETGKLALSHIRVDYAGSPVTGYMDGDTTATAEHTFSWDGVTGNSLSKATALTGAEPEPEDSVVTVLTSGNQPATVGKPVSVTLNGSTTLEDQTLTWTADPLPDGLALDGAEISGTPTTEGSTTTTLTATDTSDITGTGSLTFAIVPATVDPDPDPDPDPEPTPPDDLAERAMALLGLDPEAPEDTALANESVQMITLMVRGYTRGQGFKAETVADDIQAVILTAAVRYMANPSGLSYRAGNESVNNAFKGWTLAETFVLNNYRKRWT